MINLQYLLGILITLMSQMTLADGTNEPYNFFESFEDQRGNDSTWHGDSFNGVEQQKNQQYVGEDQIDVSPSILNHNFYENDKLRFYNQTRYDISDLKNSYLQEGLAHVSLSDIHFSLGYGMEYKFTSTHSIGYEYLSSFPSNNTQSIRLFWKRAF